MPNVITQVKRCSDQIKCMVTIILISSILISFSLLSFCQSVYNYYVTFCVFCVSLCSFLCHMFSHSLHFIFTCLGYPHNYNQQCFFLVFQVCWLDSMFWETQIENKNFFSVFCLSAFLFRCRQQISAGRLHVQGLKNMFEKMVQLLSEIMKFVWKINQIYLL